MLANIHGGRKERLYRGPLAYITILRKVWKSYGQIIPMIAFRVVPSALP